MEIDSLCDFFLEKVETYIKEYPNEIPSFTQIYDSTGKFITESFNSVEKDYFTSSHSELRTIEQSQKILNTKFLTGSHLFTILEPCTMCTGAIIQARIEKVTYFVEQNKIPGISSMSTEFILLSNHFPKLNYISDQRLKSVLQSFFKKLRNT